MKKSIFGLLIVLAFVTMAWPRSSSSILDDADPYVHELLEELGRSRRSDITPRPAAGASLELGQAIVERGELANGRQQSRHFVCTSCHSLEQETPDLQYGDPAALLAFAQENDLPVLPGTTLFGVVDRESYYNGDYEKKYGSLVTNARRDLRGAIQLCATECAQGRPLNEAEMESVVLYLRSIGLRFSDLVLNFGLPQVEAALESEDSARKESLIEQLREAYGLSSPASFSLPPEDRSTGYETENQLPVSTGESLYQRACLHCHERQRYSFFELNEESHSKEFLSYHFPRYTRYSTYQVTRYGTRPIPGKKAYMPHYTAERMSDAQIESLRAYLALEE